MSTKSTPDSSSIELPTLQKLGVSLPKDIDYKSIASAWFKDFAQRLDTCDVTAIVSMFLEDSFWRDMLALTWEFRTFHGSDRITRFLTDILKKSNAKPRPISQLALNESLVELSTPYPDLAWIQGVFSFETQVGLSSGVFRLVPTRTGEWKAHTVFTNLEGLKGFPEHSGALRDTTLSHGDEWREKRQRELNFDDSDPAVVVIGAGQAGLEIAARLKYLGVSTLVVEKHKRIGDSWRLRYEALCLHDPIYAIHMPYLPFPPTWPLWTPAAKFADWLELYAQALDINVWTSSTVNKVKQGLVTGQDPWTVHIAHSDGRERVFKPRHVIFAHGLYGSLPKIPDIPGMNKFKGKMIHSSEFKTAKDNEGKRVVIVGAATSGHDIAQDHANHGVDVTMVQRGSTYIMSLKKGVVKFNKDAYWEDSPPLEVSDLIGSSYPRYFTKLLHQRLVKEISELDRDLLEGLEGRGFKLNMGEDNSGVQLYFLKRGGGFYFDNGAGQLIIDGKIKLKADSAITRFTEDAVIFEDGTSLPVDVIILATGYRDTREVVRNLAGNSVADALNPLWGLDDEGESNSVWRWSGVPGLYFMMGNLSLCRFHSKHLALQIKALEEGIHGKRYTA